MSALSAPARGAIEAFAANLGVPAKAGRDGHYSFAFDRSGTLSLTAAPGGGRLVMSLARRPERASEATERAALDQAGLDPSTNRFLHAGLARDGSVVLAIGLAEDELSLPVLDECLRVLMARQSAVSER